MGISRVEYGSRVLVDLTGDTVTADKLFSGYTAHGANGEQIIGTASGGPFAMILVKHNEDYSCVCQGASESFSFSSEFTVFSVPSLGTYTVTISSQGRTKSRDVTISYEGQNAFLELLGNHYFIENGVSYTEWTTVGRGRNSSSRYAHASPLTVTQNDGYVNFKQPKFTTGYSYSYGGFAHCNLPSIPFTSIHIRMKRTFRSAYGMTFGILDVATTASIENISRAVYPWMDYTITDTDYQEFVLDLTEYTATMPVIAIAISGGTNVNGINEIDVSDFWVE